MRRVYYNEIEPYAADWLENLITAGHLPPGDVDRRDIREVLSHDLEGYEQCHFFAGIGGWSYALELTGWQGPVWTGSCPCQPLSSAGQRKGHADERHLWPAFYELIAKCKPPVVFGEQVASKDGREWLAGIRADLEDSGYAIGAADLPAAGVSAPHLRQRIFWVAHTEYHDRRPNEQKRQSKERIAARRPSKINGSPNTKRRTAKRSRYEMDAAARGMQGQARKQRLRPDAGNACADVRLGHSNGYHGHWWSGPVQVGWNGIEAEIERGSGKYRAQWRLKPGLRMLAHGVSNRMGRLRAYGNAIVPQVAAEFVTAYMEAQSCKRTGT